MTIPSIDQSVVGDHNIFTAAGDIKVVYELTSSDAGERRNLLVLLERVKRFWIKNVFEGSVRPAAFLLLSKTTVPDAVDHPWKAALGSAEQGCKEIPPDKNISAVFDEMGRLLLILGEAGSGKTTTLLELTRHLVAAAFADPTKPIPVVFHLSSWSEKRQKIFDWLVEELRTKYYIPPQLARTFLTDNRLLLLLDGLDEVYPAHQSACVEAINRFAREVGTPGLVVSCRYNEYRQLPQRLAFNGAVYLQPLSFEQIDEHLEERGEGLASLRTVLREDKVLQHLAGTPLLLDVMVAAYQDLPVEALRDESLKTSAARRENMFQTYVARMFESRSEKTCPFSREKLMLWTSLLANNMALHTQSIFLIERMQPTWLSSRRQLFAYLLLSRATAALVIVSPFLVSYIIKDGSPLRERIGYSIGVLSLSLVMGLWAALRKLRQARSSNEAQVSPSRPRMIIHVLGFLAVGVLFAGLLMAMAGWIWLARNLDTLTPGPHSVGLEGLYFLVVELFPSHSPTVRLCAFIFFNTIGGIVVGVFFGLIFGLLIGLRDKKRSLREDIQTVDKVGWSGARAKRAAKRVLVWILLLSSVSGVIVFPFALLVIQALILTKQGTFSGFVSGFGASGLVSLWVAVVFTLTLSIAFGPIGVLLGGLTASTNPETSDLRNTGIRNSWKKSIYAGIIVGVFFALLNLGMNLLSYRLNRSAGTGFGLQQLVFYDLLWTRFGVFVDLRNAGWALVWRHGHY